MCYCFNIQILFLQGNVTIVDTPGVGESEEMTEKLVKYLTKAVVFFYIVNSANAGGIQEDTVSIIFLSILNLILTILTKSSLFYGIIYKTRFSFILH